jgi:low affinity Fe/Cu permease
MLTKLGEVAAHPGAFGVLIVYALLWFIFDRNTLDWHAVTTLIVWFMTLLIQRAQHRDTQALQAKLDELLHAQRGADNSLTKIDSSSTRSTPARAPWRLQLAKRERETRARAAN